MALEMSIRYPRHEIEHTWPKANITQQVTQVELQTSGPQIFVDQRIPMAEVGLGDYNHFSRQAAYKGKSTVLEGIRRVAQEGDRMAAEMTTQNTIARIAKSKMLQQVPEINVDVSPKTAPEIEFHYDLNVNWREGEVKIDFDMAPPQIKWYLGQVDVSNSRGQYLDLKG